MKVYKSFKIYALRPEILSLTFGLVWAFFVFLLTLIGIASSLSNNLIEFFKIIYPWYQINISGLFLGFIWGFFNGYIFGFLVGWIYSWLVKIKVKNKQESVLEIDPKVPINIIQEGIGVNPYTIIFIANPVIKTKDGDLKEDIGIKKAQLFYTTVIRCLSSFVNNELLGLPEIFNRLRIITIFDPCRNAREDSNALCEEDSVILDKLIARYQQDIIINFVKNTKKNETQNINLDQIDIIFVISASENVTRSSSWFTVDDNSNGKTFEFAFPEDLSEIYGTKKPKKHKHAFYAKTPGIAAISAWDDRLKTPVHEFAHAMSSLENGAIIDEYVDSYDAISESKLKNIVNRRRRKSEDDPIPTVFAKYKFNSPEQKKYYSDRYRKTPDPNWTSYVPERADLNKACIMDATSFGYMYDKLLFDFMYDRLTEKLNRS